VGGASASFVLARLRGAIGRSAPIVQLPVSVQITPRSVSASKGGKWHGLGLVRSCIRNCAIQFVTAFT
jgi:hypothetical protein